MRPTQKKVSSCSATELARQNNAYRGPKHASYNVEWQRKVYTKKKKTETRRHIKRGDLNYRRDWEVHGNLSTISRDQPWQAYDGRQSVGLAGRQKSYREPKHEVNTQKNKRKKGRSVIRSSCEHARLRRPYLAKVWRKTDRRTWHSLHGQFSRLQYIFRKKKLNTLHQLPNRKNPVKFYVLRAACDASIARVTGCVYPRE